jgi:hypothetical protein
MGPPRASAAAGAGLVGGANGTAPSTVHAHLAMVLVQFAYGGYHVFTKRALLAGALRRIGAPRATLCGRNAQTAIRGCGSRAAPPPARWPPRRAGARCGSAALQRFMASRLRCPGGASRCVGLRFAGLVAYL